MSQHKPPCSGPDAHVTKTGAASCMAHVRQPSREGMPCKRVPVAGASVCVLHGGKAPQVQTKAAERIAQDQAEKWLLENIRDAVPLGSLREVYDELLAVGGMARQWRLIMAERVSQLRSLGYEGNTGEQVRADVVLFERGMDRSMKVADLIARLNLDQRRQALNERQGALVADVIRGILTDLHLTPEQQQLVGTVVPNRLRQLAAAPEGNPR